MINKNIYSEVFDKTCSVCQKQIKKDIYDQGDCIYCGWKNNHFADQNPNSVLYPNLVSLSKAKQLFSEGKPFEPNLDEFIEALHRYSEMQFEYAGVYYAVELIYDKKKDTQISLYNSQTKEISKFKNDDDFKFNAKIGNEYIKDIWEKTTDRYWLQ